MMSGSRQQAVVEARKLVRTLASAPDPRRRAHAVLAELRQAEGWSAADQQAISAAGAWLGGGPSLTELGPTLRALLSRLA